MLWLVITIDCYCSCWIEWANSKTYNKDENCYQVGFRGDLNNHLRKINIILIKIYDSIRVNSDTHCVKRNLSVNVPWKVKFEASGYPSEEFIRRQLDMNTIWYFCYVRWLNLALLKKQLSMCLHRKKCKEWGSFGFNIIRITSVS